MKRTLTILAILTVVIGVAVASALLLRPKTYSLAEDPDIELLTIHRADIVGEVNATGRLEALQTVDLSFETSGKVATVDVSAGDRVEAGVLLAALETEELEDALEQAKIELDKAVIQQIQLREGPSQADLNAAQASLDSALATLSTLQAGVPEVEIQAAQVALSSARANLRELLAGPDTNSITVAAADLRRTEIALTRAQQAYDQVAYDSRSASAQGLDLQQATIDYETALANFNLAVEEADNAEILAARSQVSNAEKNLAAVLNSIEPADIFSAQAQVAQAEAQLQELIDGASEAELALAEAAVETARLNYEQARLTLGKAKLYSPIAGTVTRVAVKAHEAPSTQEPAISLADLSGYKLEAEIDEIDINRVAVGQPVSITLDSLPDESFVGHVEEVGVAPVQETSGGIVAYPVTLRVDATDAPFKLGMNVSAVIETERLVDVVVVENRAVEIDRRTGQAFVEKLIDDQTSERVEIVLGRRGSSFSQILEGLEAGDMILIRQQSRREQLRQAIQGDGN